MIELGNEVKDIVTGFSGVATARANYLYGCERLLVESRTLGTDGKPVELWFDIQRLQKSNDEKEEESEEIGGRGGLGGPLAIPVRTQDPVR